MLSGNWRGTGGCHGSCWRCCGVGFCSYKVVSFTTENTHYLQVHMDNPLCASGHVLVSACSGSFVLVPAWFCLSLLVCACPCLFVLIHACSCSSLLVHAGPCLVVLVPTCGVLIPTCLCLLVHAGPHHLVTLIWLSFALVSAGPRYLVTFVLFLTLVCMLPPCPHSPMSVQS
jgi:hypothetical protein